MTCSRSADRDAWGRRLWSAFRAQLLRRQAARQNAVDYEEAFPHLARVRVLDDRGRHMVDLLLVTIRPIHARRNETAYLAQVINLEMRAHREALSHRAGNRALPGTRWAADEHRQHLTGSGIRACSRGQSALGTWRSARISEAHAPERDAPLRLTHTTFFLVLVRAFGA